MEEIDISQLVNFFKSKIIYIIFAMAIAFCLSSIYVNKFRVPEYTNFTTILLNQANEADSNNSNQLSIDLTINQKLISTYSEIIKSKKILNQVIDKLSLDYTYGELVNKINVGKVGDTSIIKISVTDPDSSLSADIANTIAEVFSAEIATIYKIENISIIDKAEAGSVASSTSTIKIIGVSTIAGAFISVIVIFILFYFDTTLKNEEDIERITGLPVIGIVPASREKIKYSQHRKYYDDLAKRHKNQEILPIEKEIRKIEVTPDLPQAKASIPEIKPTEVVVPEVKPIVENVRDEEELPKMQEAAIKDDLTKIKIEALENTATSNKVMGTRVSNNHKKPYYKNTRNNKK